ncbi:hypothetical protein B0H14DRAFT_2750699 [Mycena olivaceomarginata]|nr:hypothetical protein B0H14DRAFT_2750699 [Mycena olivaceomarginata]
MIISRFRWNALQIDRLLELQTGDTQLILRCLHSSSPQHRGGMVAISVHHASFLDFLKNPQRSSIFHIKLETRMNVARAVLKALSGDACWQDDFLVKQIGDNFFECIVETCSPSFQEDLQYREPEDNKTRLWIPRSSKTGKYGEGVVEWRKGTS